MGAGRLKMWTELGGEREREPLKPRQGCGAGVCGWNHTKGGVGGAECGQDYQLHVSCDQGKSCQQVGLDLVMTRAENIPFLKEEEVT